MGIFGYEDFVKKANEFGFITYSKVIDGFPKVADFTVDSQWWTGDPDHDPSMWPARAATEKKLVYGSFYKGKRGCISPKWYSVYYSAFHPPKTVEERNSLGRLGKYEWELWRLFEQEKRMLGTHEIRKFLGVTPKSGASSVDTAIANMLMTCDIVISGEVDMLDKSGKPYNKSIAYDRLHNWIPEEWLGRSGPMEHVEALDRIYGKIHEISNQISADDIHTIFKKQLRLYTLAVQ